MTGDDRDQPFQRYPGTVVLRNRLEIRDGEALAFAERMLVRQRVEEGCPGGDFDLAHLQAIHRHCFQDVYPWAGDVRLVPLAKGDSQFCPPDRIGSVMQAIHCRIVRQDYCRGLSPDRFALEAAAIMGDLNGVHPFLDGNGRTQLLYLQQLGRKAGHTIELTRLDRERWIDASIRAGRENPDYDPMRACLRAAIPGRRSKG